MERKHSQLVSDANPYGIKTMKHAQDVIQAPQDIKKTRFETPTPNQPVIRNEKYRTPRTQAHLCTKAVRQEPKRKPLQRAILFRDKSVCLQPEYVPLYRPKLG